MNPRLGCVIILRMDRAKPEWANTVALIDVTPLVFANIYTDPSIPGTDLELAPAVATVERIERFLSVYKPAKTVATFDDGGATWRHEKDPEYKANRRPKPPEVPQQMAAVRSMLAERGIECEGERGWEADDIMATICKHSRDIGHDVVIVTRDKDMWQLIQPGTWCYDPMKQVLVGAAEVEKRFGVSPGQMLDFLSLMGDSADNIPGVKGIGAKGAATLLQAHRSLDQVYGHLDDLKPKVAEKLREGRRSAFASRDLVRLRCDAPLKGQS